MIWNSPLPARLKIVRNAAFVFPFIDLMWSSMLPLLFIVIPKYFYLFVFSYDNSPILRSIVGYCDQTFAKLYVVSFGYFVSGV
jgi:hypothetical protein